MYRPAGKIKKQQTLNEFFPPHDSEPDTPSSFFVGTPAARGKKLCCAANETTGELKSEMDKRMRTLIEAYTMERVWARRNLRAAYFNAYMLQDKRLLDNRLPDWNKHDARDSKRVDTMGTMFDVLSYAPE